MIDPVVRAAVAGDAPALAALEREARSSIAERRGGTRWLEEHPERGDAWSSVLASTPTFVATIDDVALGYVVVEVDGAIATIEQVYVTPDARELGFGDELLAAARRAGAAAGASTIEGHALPGDRETKNLYERAGITARLIIVSAPISGPARRA
ncbi:MAG TPA: GNAT family N-acetyltransferase, partial [Ilumatobacteraceae bacterium]